MSSSQERGGLIKGTLGGSCLAIIIVLVEILLFALVVKWTQFNSTTIKAVNQFIKTIALFLGCLFFVRGKGGLIKGGLIGIIFSVAIHLIFMLISDVGLDLSFFIDLIFCLIAGCVSGVIAVNLRDKNYS